MVERVCLIQDQLPGGRAWICSGFLAELFLGRWAGEDLLDGRRKCR
jgi:hypothetical protein